MGTDDKDAAVIQKAMRKYLPKACW